jgi:hypothetical protein
VIVDIRAFEEKNCASVLILGGIPTLCDAILMSSTPLFVDCGAAAHEGSLPLPSEQHMVAIGRGLTAHPRPILYEQ